MAHSATDHAQCARRADESEHHPEGCESVRRYIAIWAIHIAALPSVVVEAPAAVEARIRR